MGDGMKFTMDEINTILQALYEMKGCHCYNHYEDDDNFYLILQYCAKGQIYSLLKKEGRFSEKVAA